MCCSGRNYDETRTKGPCYSHCTGRSYGDWHSVGGRTYSNNYLIETDHPVIVDDEATRSIRQAEVGAGLGDTFTLAFQHVCPFKFCDGAKQIQHEPTTCVGRIQCKIKAVSEETCLRRAGQWPSVQLCQNETHFGTSKRRLRSFAWR